MGRTTRQDEDLLQVLAARLGPSLTAGTLLVSVLDACIADLGGGAAARERAVHALREAGIEVVHDQESPWEAPAPAPEEQPTRRGAAAARTPEDVARERLADDRRVPSRRLAQLLLTAEEEVGLTLLARPGGTPLDRGGFARLSGEARAAAQAMLLHNMGLVHAVAQRLGGQGMEYDDLVASGVPGLVRAIELFDPSRGLKFSTYAMNWVRQSIGRAVDDQARLIRLPVHVCEDIRRLRAAQDRLTVHGRKPRHEALAAECDLPVSKVRDLLRLAPAVVSLETPVGNDGVTLGDLLDRPARAEEDVQVNGVFADDLDTLLETLTERELDVVRRRHGLAPHDEAQTLEEISKVHGVTRERIRQIEVKAMKKVRAALRSQGWEIPTDRNSVRDGEANEPAESPLEATA